MAAYSSLCNFLHNRSTKPSKPKWSSIRRASGGWATCFGGVERARTADLRSAIAALSQLSYGPIRSHAVQASARDWSRRRHLGRGVHPVKQAAGHGRPGQPLAVVPGHPRLSPSRTPRAQGVDGRDNPSQKRCGDCARPAMTIGWLNGARRRYAEPRLFAAPRPATCARPGACPVPLDRDRL